MVSELEAAEDILEANINVLILVLVEDGLRADDQKNFCAVSNAS